MFPSPSRGEGPRGGTLGVQIIMAARFSVKENDVNGRMTAVHAVTLPRAVPDRLPAVHSPTDVVQDEITGDFT